ncbi:MAG: Gfo/Idh/MocA family protein [Methyloligellaceae bacterium]
MIRAAMYGLGNWGQTLIRSVQTSSDKIRFTHGISRNPDRLGDFSRQMSLTITNSFQEVLADPDIDAVILATPHSQHAEQIKQAAETGKHVYVEKPMALTAASAQEAADYCAEKNVILAVGFNRRAAPAFIGLQQTIESGQIGEILHVEGQHSGPSGYRLKEGNWRGTRAEAPGGGMTARGIHVLDGMIALHGKVQSVHAMSERKILEEAEVDDTTALLMRFENGVTGYLASVFATADLYRLQVFGSKGWAEMKGPYQLSTSDLQGKLNTITYPGDSIEKGILEKFADAINGEAPYPVNPYDAVNGIAVVEAVVKSAESGDTVKIN